MSITAKYPGKCTKCGGHIAAGEKIDWDRGRGASHCNCPEHKPAAALATTGAAPVYAYTSGYAGSMGTVYEVISGDALTAEVERAAAHHNVSADEIRAVLDAGKSVTTGKQSPNHFYDHGMAKLRRRPAPRPASTRPVLRCRSCGQTGYAGYYPFSTCASSGLCDDCF